MSFLLGFKHIIIVIMESIGQWLSQVLGSHDIVILKRLFLALVLGSLIGMERERKALPAGFRTHIVLCIGSALIMVVSIHVAIDLAKCPNADPGRIAAQVVSGIGFLGAGAILRMGASVKGLTTAATLWATAGIGLAVGSGYYIAAIMTTFFLLLSLSFFETLETLLGGKSVRRILTVTGEETPRLFTQIMEVLDKSNVKVSNFSLNRRAKGIEFEMTIVIPHKTDQVNMVRRLNSIDGILEVYLD